MSNRFHALAGRLQSSNVDPGATVNLKNPRGRRLRDSSGEGTEMDDERRTAVKNAGAFLSPDLGGGGGMIPVPVNSMSSGPGEPGPEDEWKMPALPDDGAEVPKEPTPEPEHTTPGSGFLHRLTHRG
jgi:hypothetical protein